MRSVLGHEDVGLQRYEAAFRENEIDWDAPLIDGSEDRVA
jgi:hypothetical protein